MVYVSNQSMMMITIFFHKSFSSFTLCFHRMEDEDVTCINKKDFSNNKIIAVVSIGLSH